MLAGKRPLPAQITVYLRHRAVPGAARRRPAGLGLGPQLARPGARGRSSTCATCLGTTVGFHRYFTHGSFKARRPLRVALAVAGSMAVQGPILHWVADHRRHHAFADQEGDPHSPWLFGTSPAALARGFWHAHLGWILDRDLTNPERFAPDLLADRGHAAGAPAVRAADRAHACSRRPSLGGLITWSWWGALTAFFWAGLVRIARPAPRHLVGELGVPHDRRAAVRGPGPVGELLAAGDPAAWGSPGTTCTTPTRPGPGTGWPRPDRHLGPADLDLRTAGLGVRRALADPGPAGAAVRRAVAAVARTLPGQRPPDATAGSRRCVGGGYR